MYRAIDVAHYIIDYCDKHNIKMSNLKLQKVLYFVQAQFLVASSGTTPCFEDDIEAWDFGPVVPKVYQMYKIFGSSNISIDPKDPLNGYYEKIKPSDRNLIDRMIQRTIPYSAAQLVQITHNQAPWKNGYRPRMNRVISNESIYDFFKE